MKKTKKSAHFCKRMTVELDLETSEYLETIAHSLDRTKAWVVRRLIREAAQSAKTRDGGGIRK